MLRSCFCSCCTRMEHFLKGFTKQAYNLSIFLFRPAEVFPVFRNKMFWTDNPQTSKSACSCFFERGQRGQNQLRRQSCQLLSTLTFFETLTSNFDSGPKKVVHFFVNSNSFRNSNFEFRFWAKKSCQFFRQF